MKESNWNTTLFQFVMVILVIAGIVLFLRWAWYVAPRQECAAKQAWIGHDTQYRNQCYIEVCPGIWVGEYDLVDLLPLIERRQEDSQP